MVHRRAMEPIIGLVVTGLRAYGMTANETVRAPIIGLMGALVSELG